jgi:hypothetical protein
VKLERLHEYIIPAVATLAGMIFAIKLGSLTGKGSVGAMSTLLLSVACITLVIWLRAKTWILIAMTWDLSGFIPLTNLPLGVRDIVVLLVVGSYAIFYALKLIRVNAKFDMIDFLIGLMLLYLLTVYIRNPVGTAAFGSQKVGGRPYFDAGIAFSCLCGTFEGASRSSIDPANASLLAHRNCLNITREFGYVHFPGTWRTVTGDLLGLCSNRRGSEDVTERKQGLSWGSNNGMRLLCSYFPPITLLIPLFFWRFCAAIICTVGVLLSGFRSSLSQWCCTPSFPAFSIDE